jgi:prophage DNA circulation protein
MIDIQGLYNTLLQATFAGVPFAVIDTSQETGRRVQRFVFPGIDDASYQDLGADDGPIALRGLMVGDDYVAQMKTMQAACRQPGPYTLVHPWLRSLQVIFVPGSRPRFSLAANELRVARFEMQLYPYNPSASAGLDTLTQLETACDAVTAQAQNWLANALAPIAELTGALSYAQGYLTNLTGVVETAISSTVSGPAILAASTSAIAGLADTITGAASGWAGNTAAAMVAVPAAIAGACTPTVPSAVAPGGAVAAAAAADPADTASTLLAAVAGATVAAGTPAPGLAMGAAMTALLVASAVRAASGISYDSQQAAEAEGATLFAAIDAAAVAAGAQAQTDPANAAPVWRALVSLKSALAADLNAQIGRLPAVVTITTRATLPAWVLAQYISGDTPGEVFATYQDLIARNQVVHPALVPPGALEVLNQ